MYSSTYYVLFQHECSGRRDSAPDSVLSDESIPVQTLLDGQTNELGEGTIDQIKQRVYYNIIEYLDAEGYPPQPDHFREARRGLCYEYPYNRWLQTQYRPKERTSTERAGVDSRETRLLETSRNWQMTSYDGTFFQLSHQFPALFEAMVDGQEKWIKEYILNCSGLFALCVE